MNLPPVALEVMADGYYRAVEAPPCGDPLDIDSHDIHLKCDRPANHSEPRHRQVLSLQPPHAVQWCDDGCSRPCEPLRGYLQELRGYGRT